MRFVHAKFLVFLSACLLLASGGLAPAVHGQASGVPIHPRASVSDQPQSAGTGAGAPGPAADYDEQLGMTVAQNLTGIGYNVTAVPQKDSYGYGPAYFLNGLTDRGYWYQVGITYDWLYTTGGYAAGWDFIYEVWSPSGSSVYPVECCSGLIAFPAAVVSGDSVLLKLGFSAGSVQMYAKDWRTGAVVTETYGAEGASYFAGSPGAPLNYNGYFTGLMTEWYHPFPYNGTEAQVSFTDGRSGLSSAWMWMDEWEPSDPLWAGAWSVSTPGPVSYASSPDQLRPISAVGAVEASDAHEFVTGSSGTTLTTITFKPDGFSHPLSPANQFAISYVLDGQNDTAYTHGGTLALVSDEGTTLTVAGISNGSTSSERWVLNAMADPVVLEAGTTVTLYYYDLLLQTPSYAVLGSGPQVGPTLEYYTAPLSPSQKGQVSASLELSASAQQVWAARGTAASVSVQLTAGPGEAWSTQTARWTIDSPEQIPSPILYYSVYPMMEAGA